MNADREPTGADILAMAIQAHTASGYGPDAFDRQEAQDVATSGIAALRREGYVLVHESEFPSPPPTPAPTREQVHEALYQAYVGHTVKPSSLTVGDMRHLTDAVLALIAQPDREPLWTATTADSNEREYAPPGKSYLAECLLDTPPDTAVRVDEDTSS